MNQNRDFSDNGIDWNLDNNPIEQQQRILEKTNIIKLMRQFCFPYWSYIDIIMEPKLRYEKHKLAGIDMHLISQIVALSECVP